SCATGSGTASADRCARCRPNSLDAVISTSMVCRMRRRASPQCSSRGLPLAAELKSLQFRDNAPAPAGLVGFGLGIGGLGFEFAGLVLEGFGEIEEDPVDTVAAGGGDGGEFPVAPGHASEIGRCARGTFPSRLSCFCHL